MFDGFTFVLVLWQAVSPIHPDTHWFSRARLTQLMHIHVFSFHPTPTRRNPPPPRPKTTHHLLSRWGHKEIVKSLSFVWRGYHGDIWGGKKKEKKKERIEHWLYLLATESWTGEQRGSLWGPAGLAGYYHLMMTSMHHAEGRWTACVLRADTSVCVWQA